VSSGVAVAVGPDGLVAATHSTPAPPFLDLSRSDAAGHWSLVASASRRALQAHDFASGFDGPGLFRGPASLQASEGESRRASLSFDWRRGIRGDTLRAGAFADTREIAVNGGGLAPGDTILWERIGEESRRTRIGAHGAWQGFARVGTGFSTSARVRAQGDSLEARGHLDRASGEAPRLYLDERLRQSFAGVDLSTETRPFGGMRAAAGVAIERYRFEVASRRAADSGAGQGVLVSPRFDLAVSTRGGSEFFAAIGRGTRSSSERGPSVAFDPRDRRPLAHLDPSALAEVAEAGWRKSWAPGLETRLSAWQATTAAELLLLQGAGVQAVDRAAVRRGATLSARYQPAPWLSLDIDATALGARYRDGARERVSASDRQVNAGATVRNGSKWSASLFVKYLGARTADDEDALRLRSSTTVGAQFITRLDKKTRLTVDVFNVFNRSAGDVDYFAASRLWSQPGTVDGFLFHPAAPRGIRALLSTRF
jgi:hypothetical protein